MAKTHPMNQLGPSGLLWLINRTVFAPRGFALTVNNLDGAWYWAIHGDGTGVFSYSDLPVDIDEDSLLYQVEETLGEAAAENLSENESAYAFEELTGPKGTGSESAADPKPKLKLPLDVIHGLALIFEPQAQRAYIDFLASLPKDRQQAMIEDLQVNLKAHKVLTEEKE